jgi:hypothetical protein
MTVRRVHPSLIDSNNTSDGSVLIYSAANGVVEFGAASGGGDVANAWVNANDYATLLEARSNDYTTYLQAQSNDYATLLQAQSNDYSTYLEARSNDYSTFTTLEANIYNTFAYLNANAGIANIVEDTTPQLGGNLDAQGYSITGVGGLIVDGLTVDTNTLHVDSTNNRVGIGTTNPAYQFEIENTGSNALLVLDRTDGAACFIEGQATRSAFGSVGPTPLALAYNSLAVVTIGAGGAITVNPDGDGFTFPTTDGASGQVLTTDGEGNLSFQNAGGDVANAWVNANDYATLLQAQSNDYSTLLSAQSNDYITLLETQSNDYSTYLQAQSNDYSTLLEARSNDYNTYLTVAANTYNTLLTAQANDYNTYLAVTNLVNTVQNNVDSLTFTVDNIDANVYNTYTNLSQLVDTVQDNVAALSNTSNLVSDQYIISSTNTFTLSSSVNDANNILVSISGVLQSPNDDYVVTGTTLTINNTKPLTTGVDIEVRHLRAGSGISALESWSIITSNTVLSADNGYFVDVTSSPISVTLPATPTIGNRIRIIDVAGLSEINQLTVIGNGEKIQRSNTNLEVASNAAAFTLIYSNSTYGWILGEI